jgi:hypothetical protein
MIKLILIFSVLFSCGEKPDKEKPNLPLLDKNQITALTAKFEFYKTESFKKLDEKGWVIDTHCDALLFQSLYQVALNSDVGNLYLAEEVKGKFHRHWKQDCYQNHLDDLPNGSTSEISRDMLLGLFHAILSLKDKAKIRDIIKYGEKNNWIMGKADNLGAVEFRPDTIGIAYQINFFLSGKDTPARKVPLSYAKCKDYECHLRLLAIWARQRAGSFGDRDLKALRELTQIDNRNALFLGLHARLNNNRLDAQKAFQTLMNTQWFPDNRLPNTEDRCGFYLWERGPESEAWVPCKASGKTKKKNWTGIDFLIATALILGKI